MSWGVLVRSARRLMRGPASQAEGSGCPGDNGQEGKFLSRDEVRSAHY